MPARERVLKVFNVELPEGRLTLDFVYISIVSVL
jgi:hypothetical protein